MCGQPARWPVCTAEYATNERLVAVFDNEFTLSRSRGRREAATRGRWSCQSRDTVGLKQRRRHNGRRQWGFPVLQATGRLERTVSVAAGGAGARSSVLLLPGSAACLELALHGREDLRQLGLLISGQHVVVLALNFHLVLQ